MLKPQTEIVWNLIENNPHLKGFILVGGTALSMHISHRLSEDLDLITIDKKLPAQQIKAFLRSCEQLGLRVTPNDDPKALEEFEDTGMELHDYKQDFIINENVKLTLFAADDEVRPFLSPGKSNAPRVADLHEIFHLKALVCADRSKTRDWFDLYTLMNSHGFTAIDLYKTFTENARPQKFDIAISRLTSSRPTIMDEGFDSLAQNPPSIQEMAEFFAKANNEVIQYLSTNPSQKPKEPQ